MRKRHILSSKNFILLLLVGTIGFAGCKKFLDVNANPNNPDTAEPSLLLPTVEASIGQIVGNSFQVFGGIWSQYWTQNPTASQYRTIEQYNVPNSTFDRAWLLIYRNALQNAELIITNKTASGNQYYAGIAYLLKAYTYQLATDAFGDIPLSEALKGGALGSPKYDTQAAVYDSIFAYIDRAQALIGTASATSPGAQDIVFQGDMAKWKAFGNTLKLRAYLRLSNVDAAKSEAGIKALYASNPTFLTADAGIKYSTVGGNENPLYNEMVALSRTQNFVASGTVVSAFAKNNDPRAFKLYDRLAKADGSPNDTITYITQGAYAANSNKSVSPPSALVGANAINTASATVPVKLISGSESAFLQAEAVVRGWVTGGTAESAEALFKTGITQSFTALGLTGTEANAYIGSAEDASGFLTKTEADKIKLIITQKYYAMCGFQNFEAWTEWRRTGYPVFHKGVSAASTIGAGRTALRFLYPSSEVTTNAKYPGTVPIYQPVWWDK